VTVVNRRELKKITASKMTWKTELDNLLKNHGSVIDNIKITRESIDKMESDREKQREERKRIL